MPVAPSRRAVLTSAVAGAAALGIASSLEARAADRPLPVVNDLAVHAARRLSYGATPTLVDRIRMIGLSAWLDEQLKASPDVNATLASPVGALPLPTLVETQIGDPVRDLKVATFARAVWGTNQLYEVLVEFFSNHLSIAPDLPAVGVYKVTDDREVIRANVLGTFTDMLLASCQSPAMLLYLNNAESKGTKPNENYARELLELHTVGVDAGYRGNDVRDAAKALTGLTVNDTTKQFTFTSAWHATGPVKVLGWTHANTDATKGLEVATSLVTYLASHPATARRLATKLVRRFVSDTPPPGLVSSAAKVYLDGGTAIVPMVRHILLSGDFARSAGRKTMRPYEWVAAAARSLGLQQNPTMLSNGGDIVPMLQRLGQSPFEWRQPDGYPDVTSAWASTASMLARWNTAQQLVTGAVSGFKALDTAALVGSPVPATAGALVDRLVTQLLCIPVRPALRAALLRSVGKSSDQAIDSATAQALTPQLAALILSSPEAQVR